MRKKQLGQFFTRNSDYILQNLAWFVKDKEVIDPFAGSGDLIEWAKKNGAKRAVGYDVDRKLTDNRNIFLNDSIVTPKKYTFILTNPPYLNVNKADKETKGKYFKKSEFEDLYQISLSSMLQSEEGIVIVPINFLSAENSRKIRNLFFSKFRIVEMNYFKHRVFPDTTYNVVAFYYKKKKSYFDSMFSVKMHIYPDNKVVSVELEKEFDWTIGGEFLHKIKNQENSLGIYRLTERELENQKGPIEVKAAYNHIDSVLSINISEDLSRLINSNVLLLKAIDSGTEKGKIALENIRKYGVRCLISKESSRHMIHLMFKKSLSLKEQERIIELFNKEMYRLRKEHLSLFLTNYRDKDRKRVSFDFVYKFINYLYSSDINKKTSDALFV